MAKAKKPKTRAKATRRPNPQDATLRNVRAAKQQLETLKASLPATVHEAVNELDRKAGKQIDEIRGTVSDHHAAIAQTLKSIHVIAERLDKLEGQLAGATADAGLAGAILALERRIYKLEGVEPPAVDPVANGKAARPRK